MADLLAACRALAAAARTVDLSAFGTALTAYSWVPDAVEVPCFYTADVTIDPDLSFAEDDDVDIVCRVLTSRADDEAGQEQLLAMLSRRGPASVRAALDAARGAPGTYALGGACDDLHVRRISGHRLYTVGEKTYYGAEIIVRLIGEGDDA